MISPTVGRVVWYCPKGQKPDQPYLGLVAYVHSDKCVNLVVFDHNGAQYGDACHGVPGGQLNVPLLQDDDVAPEEGNYCMWTPYQKGQAAKFDEAQQEAEEAQQKAAEPVSDEDAPSHSHAKHRKHS